MPDLLAVRHSGHSGCLAAREWLGSAIENDIVRGGTILAGARQWALAQLYYGTVLYYGLFLFLGSQRARSLPLAGKRDGPLVVTRSKNQRIRQSAVIGGTS